MIKNLLIIQPIFAPDAVQAQRNIDSINALGAYLKAHGTDGINLSITMGGWAKTDELWNKVIEAGKVHFGDKFNPTKFDKNYGKAFVVNNLYKNVVAQNHNIHALISMDSDILFPIDLNHIFVRLSVASEKVVESKKMNWGIIGLNQKGAGCHFQTCYENQMQYSISIRGQTYEERMVWPTVSSGIAGGCLCINRELFDKVGGYRQFGVYAGDDAYLLYDCARLGFSYQMSDSIHIIHPPEPDQKYAEWKVRTCQRDTSTGEKANIDSQIKEADNFWNSK